MKYGDYAVILDCYTDEPSGYGVRPYLGIHQIHISQALSYQNIDHFYLTIDDLRYCSRGVIEDPNNTDLTTYYRTKNGADALSKLHGASVIYVIMGCFVDYEYFACIPPRSDEVYSYLKGTRGKKVLFYVLGTEGGISPDYQNSSLRKIIDEVAYGNTYRFVLESSFSTKSADLVFPNYDLLDKISDQTPAVIFQLRHPVIAEIECGTGCNTPFCSFCIESVRALPVVYRDAESIVKQIKCLYNAGVRHFRLGRQPNFFHFQYQNLLQMERLLGGIREGCPRIEMLHIDNVNPLNVISKRGIEITKLIVKYCTSGNIAPFGIESFDNNVRKATGVQGTADHALRAIEIINEYGQSRGSDGLPRLLPGINLIYDLPGQTQDTHKRNLECLNKIMNKDWQTRRLFFRRITSPTGISLRDRAASIQEYETWFEEIVKEYVLPMQARVYPEGTIIKDCREIIWKDGANHLRTLGTCPIRIMVRSEKLIPYESYDIRITKNLGYRLLEGELEC